MRARSETGRLGELAARRRLDALGYAVLGVNVRCGRNEIDIVAQDGDTVVFVEVRTRRSRRLGAPEESITAQKRRGMLTAAQCYLDKTDGWRRDWRIDIVAVELDRNDGVRTMRHIRNAVEL